MIDKQRYATDFINGMTYRQLAERATKETGEYWDRTSMRNSIRRTVERLRNPDDGPTLVFSDPHFPYHREGYLEFLKGVYKKYNCRQKVICLGDVVDHHAISRHESEPDAVGDITEFQLAYDEMQKLVEAFPNMVICLGNHDRIPERQAKSIGISTRYLKSFSQLWDLPRTVEVYEEYSNNGVMYQHGIGSSGKDGAINTATKMQSSYCQGHTHAFAGVKWAASPTSLIFGLNTGCLCDPKSIAMAYGKASVNRPVLGCGVVHDKYRAEFIPFVLD